MPQATEVQEKDKIPSEEVTQTAEQTPDSESQTPPVALSKDDLEKKIREEPGFADVLLHDWDKFVKVVPDDQAPSSEEKPAEVQPDSEVTPEVKPAEGEKPAADKPAEEAAGKESVEGGADEEKPAEEVSNVTLTFDKTLLGTYKDVDAMSKGNREKDKTIGFLKRDRIPRLETELGTAQTALDEEKA
ncbi:unnamed protein product, partial [marine sediment metagenome]